MTRILTLIFALLVHGHASALTIATGSTEGTYFKIAQDNEEPRRKQRGIRRTQ